MFHLARPGLRLIIGPALVAAFAGFELRDGGTLAALAGAWCVFVICVFGIEAWGRLQLERGRRRLQSRRSSRPDRTR
jgi:hypothetical protein